MDPLSLIYKKRRQVCWYRPGIPATGEAEAEGSQAQGLPRLQGEFEANLGM